MRMLLALGMLAALAGVIFLCFVFGASEFGGEVVTLHTHAANGADKTTHLWVVDDVGFAWLRAGVPTSAWLRRIEANPDVTIERGGQLEHFKAVPVREPAVRNRIHELMRQKYAWSDRIAGLLRSPDGSVPVRLEPEQPPRS